MLRSLRRLLWSDRSRAMRLVLLLLLLVLCYATASLALAMKLTAPHRPLRQPTPSDYDLVAEDVHIETADGIDLAGWIVEPASSRGVVLLFHGVRDTRPAHRMKLLSQAGFTSLAVDHRGHGGSGGDLVSSGWLERADVEATIRYARARWPGARVGAWGFSMGAAAIAFAWETSRTLDAIVLDAMYATLGRAYDRRIALRIPRGLRWLGRGPRWGLEWRFGIALDDISTVATVGRLAPAPLLISTGALDERAAPDDLRAIAAAAPFAEAVVVPGVDHRDPAWSGPDHVAYRDRVLAFFGRYLDPDSGR